MIVPSKTNDTLPVAMTTGQVARRFKITLQTLHFYEDEGLVVPAREKGRRLYDDGAVARLGFIVEHRRLGLSIKRIAEMLAKSSLLVGVAHLVQ